MKKLGILFCVTMLLVLTGCAAQEISQQHIETVPDCVVCSDSDGKYWLTIIANQDEITDKEKFSKQMIEMVRNNEFKRIMFSYDVNGYPIELRMNVYLTEEDWQDRDTEPYMQITFEQESIINGYNIVEHYEQFALKID